MSKEMREQINRFKNWEQFLNENEETIPTENNPWQDYVEKFNAGKVHITNFHSYEYIKYAASEVLYEFTIGLKKFLEEKGITVLDIKKEPYPELTASFSYYRESNPTYPGGEPKLDKDKKYGALSVSWKNDEKNIIENYIIDYYKQHKDKVSPFGLSQGEFSTRIFFKDRRDIS